MSSESSLPAPLREGIFFACTHCGACCSGEPGRVRVTPAEILRMAAYLNDSPQEFMDSYTRSAPGGEWLLNEEPNGDCVFFRDRRCILHPVKPGQCRRYPFWFRNVRSEAAWAKTSSECPGIGQGDFYAPGEIVRRVREDLEA